MRKILLSMSAVLLYMSAQGQTVFSEDFDGIGGPTAGGAGPIHSPQDGYFVMLITALLQQTYLTSMNHGNVAKILTLMFLTRLHSVLPGTLLQVLPMTGCGHHPLPFSRTQF